METIVKGIVISIRNYQEFDIIAKILTPKRIFAVIALGVRKPESKNRFGLIFGTYGEFEIYASRFSNSLSKLKKANPLISYEINNKENLLTYHETFSQLNRLKNINQNFFTYLEKIWPLWGKNNNYNLMTLMLNQALKLYGIYPNFKSCVECRFKNEIADFKYYKGGFLCSIHKTQNLNLEILYAYYYLDQDFDKYLTEVPSIINQQIYQELTNFLDENTY